MTDLVVASANKNKLREIQEILPDYNIISLSDIGFFEDIVEDGDTFAENALIKASTIAGLLKRPVLADDSGLEVDALGGAPGVYSARYGGPGLKDEERLQLLLDEMKDVPDAKRTARFVCVMALVYPDGTNLTARGTVEGSIIREAQGNGGFGYDPAFLPRGYQDTFGILPAETKNRISHRSMALLKMKKLLEARG